MATVYSPEYKASIIERMLPPNNVSVSELVRETGIPKDTLYCWRSRAREQGLEAAQASGPASELSSGEKFAVVVESAALNAAEPGEYCRRKGLYPQQIAAWKASCMQANALMPAKRERAETRAHKQQIKTLERELRRKDKALAEAAALLVLEKKLQTLLAADAGERSTWSSDAP
jgi:transposase-like protein